MKRVFYAIALLVPCLSIAQISPQEISSKIDAVEKMMKAYCSDTGKRKEMSDINDAAQIMTSSSYKKYIDQYFTYLAYNRGTLPSGNSAAIELTNNSTQLDLSLSKKIEPKDPAGPITLFTGGVKAKINDGISQLFSGGNLSTGTSLFLNFARLPGKAIYRLKYVVGGFDENGQPVKSPFDELKKKREEYIDFFCENSTEYFPNKYRALLKCWYDIKSLLSSDTLSECNKTDLYKKKEEIEKQLSDAGLLTDKPDKIAKAMQKLHIDKMYDIEAEDKSWLLVRFIWLSGGIVYTRQSFNTYDENKILAKRFDSKDFDEAGLKLTLNYFQQNMNGDAYKGSYYFNVSYEGKTTNNFLALKNLDILRNIIRTTNPDTTYSIQTSQKVKNITDKIYQTGWQHTIGMAGTWMLGEKQNGGINVNASWVISPLLKPIYSTHAGALLRFNNNKYDPTDKKSSAKVNFEIFIEFNDMSDVGASAKSVWQNKLIGINTSVPFNKIFFK